MGVTTGNLHDMWVNPRPFGADAVFFIAQRIIIAGDHLGNDERRAKATRNAPHANISDAGHGGQTGASINRH